MDTLPEEILGVIITLCGKHSIIIGQVCKHYHGLYLRTLDNIKNGFVTPDIWLPTCDYDVAKFKEPIDDFLALEGEQYHDNKAWDVNSVRVITAVDKAFMKKIMYGEFEAVYCAKCPDSSSDYWLLIARTSKYYICFMSSCSYSVFWPDNIDRFVTGGTFAYHEDWKTLWNMYLTRDDRNDLLELTGYIDPDWEFRKFMIEVWTPNNTMQTDSTFTW